MAAELDRAAMSKALEPCSDKDHALIQEQAELIRHQNAILVRDEQRLRAYDAMRDSLAYIDSIAPEIRDDCDDEHAEIIVTVKALRDLRAALAAAEGKVDA